MYVTDLDSLNGNYVWCIGCNRAYKKTNMKWNSERENYECKHDDCNFRMKGSFWPYDVYRQIFGWPKIPIEGKKYQMTGN